MKSTLAATLLAITCLMANPAFAFLGNMFGGAADSKQAEKAGKQEIQPALGDAAAKTGPFATLADVGMGNFKTLWIPAQYTGAGKAQFYINGRKFAAPGGHDHVVGFLPAPYGYFVAVNQPVGAVIIPQAAGQTAPALTPEQMAKLTPEQQIAALQLQLQMMQIQAQSQPQVVVTAPASASGKSYVVFYKVSPAGEVLGTVAEVQAGTKAWVTPEAIFVAQTVGERSASGRSLAVFNVVGYKPNGDRMEGPQGAVAATPGPNGDWYWYNLESRGKETFYQKMDKAGNVKRLYGADTDIRYETIVNSQQAFVDLPPIADSIRTNRIMYVYWDSGRGGIKGPPDGTLYVSPLNIGLYKEREWVGTLRDYADLISMGERSALFGTPDSPRYAGQAVRSAYKEPGVNLYVLNPDNPDKDYYALYNVMGRGTNVMRSIFGNNTGSFTLDSRNDLFVFVTPTTTVGVKARAGDDGIQGFDLINRKAIAPQEVQSFVAKHGLVTY
jgi:hypothetical protein